MSQIRPGPMPPKPEKTAKERKPWKRKSRLKQVSDKLRASLVIYHKVTKPAWLALYPRCQFVLTPGASCGEINNVTVHHKKGRGKNLNDPRFFFTACRTHHRYIHDNPAFSYANGYLIKRWK